MRLPKGKYFIGDPCYCFGDSWIKLLGEVNYFNEEDLHYFKGYPLTAANTAYGDGTYFDQEGNLFHVDAGLIGVVPEELWEETPNGGIVVEFEEEFEVDLSVDGVVGKFNIGGHVIDTAFEEDEDEENRCESCGRELFEVGELCYGCKEEEERMEENDIDPLE